MDYRRRRLAIAGGCAALALVAANHPATNLDLRFETHEVTDLAPHRVKAAVDLGLVGVSVLYTWTERVTR